MKVVIIVCGAGAAGKTTSTQAFAEGEPIEHSEMRMVDTRAGKREMKVSWTVYENCAVAGNHHSGTDANGSVSCTTEAMIECAKERDIIIVDGYMSSPRWVETANSIVGDRDGGILVVWYALLPETTLHRLAKRRGVTVESIREKMLPKHEGLVKRVQGMVTNVMNLATVPYWIVSINDDMSTDDIIELMDDALYGVYEEFGLDYGALIEEYCDT